MDMILPIMVNGCAMALVALGFHLVIRSTGGIVDFAVGQYAIISGMAAASIGSELGLGTVLPSVLDVWQRQLWQELTKSLS
jgi:hypothetical protein